MNSKRFEKYKDRFDDNSICSRCGNCCYFYVPIEGKLYRLPSLPCKFLKQLDNGTTACTVFSERMTHPEAMDWCVESKEAMHQGLLHSDCPYVCDIKGYKGSIVCNPGMELLVLLEALKANCQKPPMVSDKAWLNVLKKIRSLGQARFE